MRRQRARADGGDGGDDALLGSVRRAIEPGDVCVELLDRARLDRAVPRVS
jgi:hypothetical protein